MMISQREAKRLKRRVAELEESFERQRRTWSQEYFGGVHIGRLPRDRDWFSGRIEMSRRLGHAVVVTCDDDGTINFYALPQAK